MQFLAFCYTQVGPFLTKNAKLGHFGHLLARLKDFQNLGRQNLKFFVFFSKNRKKIILGDKLCHFGPEMGVFPFLCVSHASDPHEGCFS